MSILWKQKLNLERTVSAFHFFLQIGQQFSILGNPGIIEDLPWYWIFFQIWKRTHRNGIVAGDHSDLQNNKEKNCSTTTCKKKKSVMTLMSCKSNRSRASVCKRSVTCPLPTYPCSSWTWSLSWSLIKDYPSSVRGALAQSLLWLHWCHALGYTWKWYFIPPFIYLSTKNKKC